MKMMMVITIFAEGNLDSNLLRTRMSSTKAIEGTRARILSKIWSWT